MQQQIAKFEKYLDSLSKRDQIALFVTFLVVVMMIWTELIYAPLSEEMTVVEQEIAQKTSEIEVFQAKTLALQKSINTDPDAENRQQFKKYLEESMLLDEALAKTSTQIISPQEMTGLMEQILKSQAGLKFVSLKKRGF